MRVELRGGRSVVSRLASRSPLGVRVLPPAGDFCRVALVHTAATLVGGDRVRLDVDVGPGASCELLEISATVAHPTSGGSSIEKALEVTVADGGTLVINEQALIVAQATDVRRTTTLALAGAARAAHREMLVLGRAGETPGAATIRSRVQRDGMAVFDDTIDTRDTRALRSPAVFGQARVLGCYSLWGAAGAVEGAGVFELGPHDRVSRVLAELASAAASELDAFEARAAQENLWLGDSARGVLRGASADASRPRRTGA